MCLLALRSAGSISVTGVVVFQGVTQIIFLQYRPITSEAIGGMEIRNFALDEQWDSSPQYAIKQTPRLNKRY